MTSPRPLHLLSLLLLMGWVAPVRADLALARSKNCMSCHTAERKVIGPALKEIAVRYKDQKGAAELLAQKITKGGTGVWGAVPMPANTQVSEADARKLAVWILQMP